MNGWHYLAALSPPRPAPANPRRIVLIRPCCIGDVVLATATLMALRRAYPQAHITWAVGRWSRAAIEQHVLLDALLDCGPRALPTHSPLSFWRFVRRLRQGNFDLAVSLVRSPLMSLALRLAGIPYRAGLDSAGRGFGYNIRAPIDPLEARHEAEIYLDVARVLGLNARDCQATVPVDADARLRVRELLAADNVVGEFLVVNPGGGRNPGATMDSKRWPPQNFAALAERLLAAGVAQRLIVLGGPDDSDLVQAVASKLKNPPVTFVGALSFGEIAALASMAQLYIGNDSGLTHLAAAAGGRAVMILGPSDPARYAPFTEDALALWKPVELKSGGVAAAERKAWDWERDGIDVDAATEQILAFLGAT